ncbi:hypothetical protein OAS35_01960 [Pelagibacteraceae bacterium]|nr:hypothetical protein [Pelagibacteraceae bacterium]
MRNKFLLILILTFSSLNINAKDLNLQNKYIPLKDFIILKYEIFFKENSNNIFRGGGAFGVAYQDMTYSINVDNYDNINISIDAIMDKKRYKVKKYYPKLRDCNQVRNKIFINKYGYSFLTQKLNNLASNESLYKVISDKILNISFLDEEMKRKLLDKTKIKINVLHPGNEKSLSCGGNLLSKELKIE